MTLLCYIWYYVIMDLHQEPRYPFSYYQHAMMKCTTEVFFKPKIKNFLYQTHQLLENLNVNQIQHHNHHIYIYRDSHSYSTLQPQTSNNIV